MLACLPFQSFRLKTYLIGHSRGSESAVDLLSLTLAIEEAATVGESARGIGMNEANDDRCFISALGKTAVVESLSGALFLFARKEGAAVLGMRLDFSDAASPFFRFLLCLPGKAPFDLLLGPQKAHMPAPFFQRERSPFGNTTQVDKAT